MDADRDTVLRRLLKRAEIRSDGLARHFRELGDVRLLTKTGTRLVERDVTALAQAEDHQVKPAGCLNGSVVIRRVLSVRVRIRSMHGRKRLRRREGRKRRTDRVRALAGRAAVFTRLKERRLVKGNVTGSKRIEHFCRQIHSGDGDVRLRLAREHIRDQRGQLFYNILFCSDDRFHGL